MKDNEKTLGHIAKAYAEREGKSLQREAERLDEEAVPSTRRLETLVHGAVHRQKRGRSLRVAGALAACLLLAFLAVRTPWPPAMGPAPSTAARTAAAAAQPSAAPAASSAAPAASAASSFAVIPLSFRLPESFSQTGFAQDNEKSVYYLEDAYLDDVVMTLQRADAVTAHDGLTAIAINGTPAYAARTATYSLLTFSADGVDYVLTCRHDINTLVRLGEAIL